MNARLVPLVLGAALLGSAITLAIVGVDHDRAPAIVVHPDPEPPADPTEGRMPALPPHGGSIEPRLPPDHPPIDQMGPPAGAAPEPPALSWTVPPGWEEAPNPNPMRLATYRIPGGAEMSVARAGGSTDANIERWVSQFDDAAPEKRDVKNVGAVHVTTVHVSGTYDGGGTMAGAASPERRPGWALLGAIAETSSGYPYFFKMLGPQSAVDAARPAFDKLIATFRPR